jgi:hypothetical protein
LFKEFINKGNVIDVVVAVVIVIGGVFGKIVSDRLRSARGCAARGAIAPPRRLQTTNGTLALARR